MGSSRNHPLRRPRPSSKGSATAAPSRPEGSLRRRYRELKQLSDNLLSTQLELADLAHELETILETIDQGLLMVDGEGVLVHCNSQARRLLDLPEELITARPTFREILEYQWRTNLSGRDESSFEAFAAKRMVVDRKHVQEITRPDSRIIEVRSTPLASGGFVRTYLDITERKTAEDKVRYLAHHDDLTQLANRVVFRERLAEAVRVARASGRELAVLYLDLDHFKQVNDTRGHEVGDRVLAEAARRLRTSVREIDTVARLGGDEFAMLLPFAHGADAIRHAARRILKSFAVPFTIGEHASSIGISIGVAMYPHDGVTLDALLQAADAALYEAKRAGRNDVRFASPAAQLELATRHL
jgi:diguanylate cyclase (GGDEF)-like protein